MVAGDGAAGDERGGLAQPRQPGAARQQPGAPAPEVADAVDVDSEVARRVHGDAEVDRLTGRHRVLRGEPLDLAGDVVGEPRAAAEEMRPFREEHLTRSARAGTPPESWARDAATYAAQPHRRAAAPTRRPWTRARRGRSTQAR